MIDTHAHLNFEVFTDTWRDVVKLALKAGVEKIIVPGTDLVSSKRAVEMAQEHEALYASVGIHPHHSRALLGSSNANVQMSKLMEELFELAQKPKVVAIGEVGLDYHVYRNSKYKIQNNGKEWETVKGLQRELLTRQVRVAGELDKPLVLHSREAGSDVLEILKPLVAESYGQARQVQDDGNFDKLRGVFHCYEGSKKYARRVLEAGFYISFTGNITYSPDRMEVAKTIPADRLLLETDSPYMTPQSEREAGLVNTPYNVRIVASYLAEARDVQINELERTTTQNAERLFGF